MTVGSHAHSTRSGWGNPAPSDTHAYARNYERDAAGSNGSPGLGANGLRAWARALPNRYSSSCACPATKPCNLRPPTKPRDARHARLHPTSCPPRPEGDGGRTFWRPRFLRGARGLRGRLRSLMRPTGSASVPPLIGGADGASRLAAGCGAAAESCWPLDAGMSYFNRYPKRASNARRNGVSARAALSPRGKACAAPPEFGPGPPAGSMAAPTLYAAGHRA